MFSGRPVLAAAALLAMAFGIASAQQTATVSGEVLDDSGLVIPGGHGHGDRCRHRKTR